MKFSKLVAAASLLLLAAGLPAQQAPPPAAPGKVVVSTPQAEGGGRRRGHVRPADLDRLIAASHARHLMRLRALPRAAAASFDARAKGWVGPVKDQGQCGSCWDFSGTGVVEIAYNKAGVGGGPAAFVLSEQYTLGCGRNGGCNGDDNTTVLDWAKATGLPLSSAYGPYTGGGGPFARCDYTSAMPLYKVPDWGFADSNGGRGVTSVADIKAAIQAYGCVGVAVAADAAFEGWGDNHPTFTSPFRGSGSTNIDHDVILVGWQDDASKAGGCWILRNSWGANWGVGGYMAIAYGANLVGTEAVFALPPAGPSPIPPVPPPPAPGAFTYALTGTVPPGASIDPNTGVFTWNIPAAQAAGLVTIDFTAAAGGGSAAGSFAIVVAAADPVIIAPIPASAATAGRTFTLELKNYVSRPATPGDPAPAPKATTP